MRLWPEQLIPHLDRQRLLGQHRECCALRGLGWGRKHSTVDYVFKYSPIKLYYYHMLVMNEMQQRGYKVDRKWCDWCYRGQHCRPWPEGLSEEYSKPGHAIFCEHNDSYLQECLQNLRKKGADPVKFKSEFIQKAEPERE